jgi:hypothetical protein
MPRAIDQVIRDALWQAHQQERLDSSALAVRFNLSRRTVQNLLWQARRNSGIMPAAAYHCPDPASQRHANCPIFLQAQALRRDHPEWGADLIHVVLAEQLPDLELPCSRTLQRWFAQLNLSPAPPGRRVLPAYRRATLVHQTWQCDAADQVALADGSLASCLRCVDECSGAFLGSRVFPQVFNSVPPGDVQAAIRAMFNHYGLPEGMRLDNGMPWGGSGNDLPSVLALWLVGLGLQLTFNPPRQPRYNGVVEKSNHTNQRWSEPHKALNAEQWQQCVDAMDRRQREAYPFLGCRSRLAVFPELKQTGQQYSANWEEQNWDIQKAREYLAGFVAMRKVSAAGRITLYHRPYYPGRKHAGKTVLVSYDPQRCEWFVTEQGGGELRRLPAPEICRESIRALTISA